VLITPKNLFNKNLSLKLVLLVILDLDYFKRQPLNYFLFSKPFLKKLHLKMNVSLRNRVCQLLALYPKIIIV